jgi:hypothetical protein
VTCTDGVPLLSACSLCCDGHQNSRSSSCHTRGSSFRRCRSLRHRPGAAALRPRWRPPPGPAWCCCCLRQELLLLVRVLLLLLCVLSLDLEPSWTGWLCRVQYEAGREHATKQISCCCPKFSGVRKTGAPQQQSLSVYDIETVSTVYTTGNRGPGKVRGQLVSLLCVLRCREVQWPHNTVLLRAHRSSAV